MNGDLYDPDSFDQRLGDAVYRTGEWLRRNFALKVLKRRVFHPVVIGVAYAAIGFGEFGHVASANYAADQYEYVTCDNLRKTNPDTAFNSCDRPDAFGAAIKGVAAGAAWPLYLSWEAQQ